ncbi:MAG: hypothetical protein WC861_03885 [Candidatus Micrarchaeia archaeon]|jgi:hypothetical protein
MYAFNCKISPQNKQEGRKFISRMTSAEHVSRGIRRRDAGKLALAQNDFYKALMSCDERKEPDLYKLAGNLNAEAMIMRQSKQPRFNWSF